MPPQVVDPAAQSLDMCWEPACDIKDLIFSKQFRDKEIYQVGERVGLNGNREFICYDPRGGQEFHLYRPFGWW
jgi:hypothetical protein